MKTEALVLLVFALAISVADCNHEVDVLSAWKSVLVDPNNVLQSWDPTLVNPCIWLHVTCNINDSVVRLDLLNTNLSGPLIPQLGQLPNLEYLEVFGNKLRGAIPVEIANLTKLKSLGLHHNQLSGVIPRELGNLRFLRFMRLNSNKLSGTVPDTVIRLIFHGSLQILNVSDNHLAGTVHTTPPRKFFTTIVIRDLKVGE